MMEPYLLTVVLALQWLQAQVLLVELAILASSLVLSPVDPLAQEQESPDVQEIAAPALVHVNSEQPLAFQAVAPVEQSVLVLAVEVLEQVGGDSVSECQHCLSDSYSGRKYTHDY